MSEGTTDRPQGQAGALAASGAAPGGNGQPGDDPLAKLHKMSRTAGLGSAEYVAINATAVAAIILGLLSFGAVLSEVLLVLPLAAVVSGIIAIRQIRNSAGTQTGRGIALIGILLGLGFLGAVGGGKLLHLREVRQERGKIIALIEQFGQNLSRGDFEAVWEQFSPRFHQRVRKEDFLNLLSRMTSSPYYGKVLGVRSTGIVDVERDPQTGVYYGRGMILVDLEKSQEDDRRAALFSKTSQGQWVFEDIEGYFQSIFLTPQQMQQRSAQPQGPPPPGGQ
ncbi:DUF4190 domain-containing protein [Fontivita pretiosa]|uniref:DUF4190 domain-containing protein n=1 Tax=Fontivita pretiosa TaxID=2989684 RepID=UPI003D176B9D